MDESKDKNTNSTQAFVYAESLEIGKIDEFKKELEQLINRHSLENGSDTPDFILAEFMCDCLMAVNKMAKRRDEWYGDKRWSDKVILNTTEEVGSITDK